MTTNEAVAVEAVDSITTDRLVSSLRQLAEDTQALLAATADATGQQIAQARAKVDDSLAAALAHVGDARTSVRARTAALGRGTDAYVRAHRWQVLAASAAAGFVIGALLVRHGTSETQAP